MAQSSSSASMIFGPAPSTVAMRNVPIEKSADNAFVDPGAACAFGPLKEMRSSSDVARDRLSCVTALPQISGQRFRARRQDLRIERTARM
ncbi:MAG: hypothetical protein WBW93_09030 [Steroidobacteraceae bacterium]